MLHTVTVPHGVVAALAYNDTRDVSGNRLNMTSAIAMMTVIEIARAVKDSSVGGLNVQKDDFIGLVDGKLQTRSDTIGGLISSLMPQIKDQYVELATIYKGAGVTETDESPVVEAIEANYPDVEIEIVEKERLEKGDDLNEEKPIFENSEKLKLNSSDDSSQSDFKKPKGESPIIAVKHLAADVAHAFVCQELETEVFSPEISEDPERISEYSFLKFIN